MLEAPRRALSIALVSAVVSAARGGGVSFNAHFVLRGRVVVPPPFSLSKGSHYKERRC